jgi:3-phenylpropionate/trans-cinnamate dioxygenase ferredoxin reductase subunit
MAGVVIVGAGHGGTQLAASLREAGYAGTIDLVSAEPDLPYHKPPLSKSFMKTPDTALQLLRAEVSYAEKDIRLHLGHAITEIDRVGKRVTFDDGASLAYDKLVLATGAEARTLTLPGAELAGVFSLRTAADARALRAALPANGKVVVIGGGFIGLEAAAMLAGRGLDVTVAELAPRLLGRATSPVVAGAVADQLATIGVRVLTGVSVEGIEGDKRVRAVRLARETLPADLVIVGIGAIPVTGLAAAAGLALDNGISVDALLATSDPSIWAIGDCASFPRGGRRLRLESVQNATDQARALAATLACTATPYNAVPWFWSDIGPMKLQIAGLSDGADETIETRDAGGMLKSVYHLADGRLVAVETINSNAEHMPVRRLLADGVTPPREVLASGDPARIKAALQSATASA